MHVPCSRAHRNCKSRVVDFVAKMLVNRVTSVPIESLTGSDARKGADATPDLVKLPGARLVRAAEPEQGVKLKEAMIKQLTGGEPILVRKMREEFMEIEPIFKLTISANHKPNVTGTDDGIWRRIMLVPFEAQVASEDVDVLLDQKLWSERSGILNWLIEGAIDFMNGGLREPASVIDATAKFREESEATMPFLTEWCEVTSDAADRLFSREIVQAFQVYRTANTCGPWSDKYCNKKIGEFAGKPTSNGQTFTREKFRAGNGYAGIRLMDFVADKVAASAAGGGGWYGRADDPGADGMGASRATSRGPAGGGSTFKGDIGLDDGF